ncbi:ATP-grasp fold amidoligase family protein [Roseibium salinum]|nr:ATP-grasp fold amidoligase family protein [Roseibium salinum]
MFEAVYAPDWQLLDIHMDFYPLLREPLPRPARLDKMLEIVRKIGSGIRFARIDLYDTQEGPFVGEITLYPSGGDLKPSCPTATTSSSPATGATGPPNGVVLTTSG